MNRLIIAVLLVVLFVEIAVGFYRRWFAESSGRREGQLEYTLESAPYLRAASVRAVTASPAAALRPAA
jgi:hypothetical protein